MIVGRMNLSAILQTPSFSLFSFREAVTVGVLCLLGVGLIGGTTARAQTTYAARTSVEAESDQPERSDRSPVVSPLQDTGALPSSTEVPNLDRVISVDLTDATLEEALNHVADKARLEIGYLQETVSGAKRVTLQSQSISVRTALREVLKGTNLRLVATTGEHLALLERTAPHARRIEESPLRIRYDMRTRDSRFRTLHTLKDLLALRGTDRWGLVEAS
jgi:hypothetical protein